MFNFNNKKSKRMVSSVDYSIIGTCYDYSNFSIFDAIKQ